MSAMYKRGDVWWCTYYENGRRIRRSLHTQDQQTAMDRMPASATPTLPAGDITVSELWAQYEAWALRHMQPKSIERCRTFWSQIMATSGASLLSEIDITQVERWQQARLAAGNKPATLNAGIRTLKAIWNRAIRQGWYAGPNPWTQVTRYREPVLTPEYLSMADVRALLACAPDPETFRLITLTAFAGLRRNEALYALWDWFHWGEQPRLQVRGHAEFHVKDHDERSIPMHERIRNAFEPVRGDGYVFGGSGSRLRADFRTRLCRAYRGAGLDPRSPFQRLRYTFGSLLAQQGVSLFKISKWMGHSSVLVTQRHYAHLQTYDSDINLLG